MPQAKYNNVITAAQNNDLESIVEFVKEGADLNIQDDFGETALSVCASSGHTEIVEILVNNNADINITNSTGESAFCQAAVMNNIDIAKLLLKAGVDLSNPNESAESKASALLFLTRYGHTDVLKDCLLAGAKGDVLPDTYLTKHPEIRALINPLKKPTAEPTSPPPVQKENLQKLKTNKPIKLKRRR